MNNVAYLDNSFDEKARLETGSQLKTHYDSKTRTGWFLMKGRPRPSFTPKLLGDISEYFDLVKQEMYESKGARYDYLVLGSDVSGIFNLGGDLNLFAEYIQNDDRDGLLAYALQCIDLIYQNMSHLDSDLTTISLVQGDALGGGLESAISANVVIAERGVKMGLPEVLFNFFPGIGAFSILSRKVGYAAAEKLILSGQLFSAEELYDMGVVDILAEKGEGELAVYRYIKTASGSRNTYKTMRKVKDICNQVSYKELKDIALVWVDAAFQLTAKDLRMMSRLVNRQNMRIES